MTFVNHNSFNALIIILECIELFYELKHFDLLLVD